MKLSREFESHARFFFANLSLFLSVEHKSILKILTFYVNTSHPFTHFFMQSKTFKWKCSFFLLFSFPNSMLLSQNDDDSRLTRHKPEIISSANTKYADEGQFAIFRSVPRVHLFSSRGSVSSAGVENWPDSIVSFALRCWLAT